MDFKLDDERRKIRDRIQKVCEGFGDEYWREEDEAENSPGSSTKRSQRTAGSAVWSNETGSDALYVTGGRH